MKLSKIEITNFRCFESLALELQPDVNVIVGVNGAGKTTILDAVSLVLYDVVAANITASRGVQEVTLRPTDIHIQPGASDEAVMRKEYVHIRAQAGDFYAVPGFPAVSENNTPMQLEWDDLIQYQPPRGFRYSRKSGENDCSVAAYYRALWKEIRKADEKALIPLPVVAYYRAGRSIAKAPDLGEVLKKKLVRQDAFKRALNASAGYDTFFQWFYLRENNEVRERLRRREDVDFQYSDLRAVRGALVKVIERVKEAYFDGNPPTFKIVLDTADGGRSVLELEQLSDGYRNLLALVLDFARRLAQAHPNWEDPLSAPGIMLIDEIELHLHPKWQQTVVPSLREAFPNTQMIVTTHSPEVLTTVEGRCVQIIEQQGLRPCPVPTYGARCSDVVAEVMGLDSLRPPDNPNAQNISRLFTAIDDGNLNAAQSIRLELAEWAKGFPEPDLVRADLMIRRLEAKGNGKDAAKP